ncbi:hypothetical protein C2G38_2207198 [Gigaspora rosea]|uniref:Deoxynucleoside kinase domain-containing protein n=1 Tax=Gigaspora rosea TaxID=44941 RepID=A0A397UMN4_9GLOM|nr:hypothetical protein C2G38_2207198 [Gigaspora rosea]
MTRKEQDLLCKYEVFESKKITFSNKKEHDIFRDLIETLSLNKDITSKFAKFEKARKWRKQQDQKRKELTNSRSNTEYSESESEKELIIIDSDGEEITMDKPGKRVITKLSKLSLSKLLDLKEISELSPDQYKITKNTLFYLKQQETKKIQEFFEQDPKITKGNYPNIANSFHDHFNMYFNHIRSHAKLVAEGGAIAIEKTTFFGKLKEYLMSLGYQTFLPQEVTLEHKPLLSLISKNDFWPFTWLNVKDPEEGKELARFYKATLVSFDIFDRLNYELYFTCKKETMIQRQKERSRPEEKEIPQGYLEQLWDIYNDNIKKIYPNYIRIPTDIRDPYHMIRSLFIHEAKGLRRIEEKPITPSINEYIKTLPITGYILITPFRLSNSKYQVLAAKRSMTTKVYAQQFSYIGGKKETTD